MLEVVSRSQNKIVLYWLGIGQISTI